MNRELPDEVQGRQGAGRGGRHGWMMIACCIPMLVIGIALVVTGVVRPGFLVFAVLCTAAMALMMRGMNHGSTSDGEGETHDRH